MTVSTQQRETVLDGDAATWILQHEQWDFMAVYYNAIDHFSHGFMQYHPPRMDGIPEEKFERYKGVVSGAYRFHDMMLQALLELAGPDVTVVLVSDHGFHSDHLRPRGIPVEPAGPSVQHRPFGIVCMQGPHIKGDERIYGATVLDITPTILTLFGLPVGQDMDGRVLVQVFEEPPSLTRIPSWESEVGNCGMHPADLRIDSATTQAVLRQFAALGYIQSPSEDQAKAVEAAVREQQYNLARVYLDSRRYSEALPLLEELRKKWPAQGRFAQHLAHCYLGLGRRGEAKAIVEQLLTREPANVTKASGNVEPSEETKVVSKPRPWADLLLGIILFEEGDMQSALACLLRAEQSQPQMPDLHLRIGETYVRLRQTPDAARAFQRALDIDGDSPEAHLGLALVLLRQRRNEEAAEQALLAVGLQHFLPFGHFYLGVALARLGHRERAALAFEIALSMLPGLIPAHRWLARHIAIRLRTPGAGIMSVTADFLIANHRHLFARVDRQFRSGACNTTMPCWPFSCSFYYLSRSRHRRRRLRTSGCTWTTARATTSASST